MAQLTTYLRGWVHAALYPLWHPVHRHSQVKLSLKKKLSSFIFSEPGNKSLEHEFFACCFLFQGSLHGAVSMGKGLGKTMQVNQINYIHRRLTQLINY